MSRVPRIRFKGFEEDWEQRKWIDVVDISKDMVDPQNGKYDNLPHISPGNIESFTGQLYDNVKCVKDENLISGKFKFSSGDIIYGKINPQLGKYLYATFSGLTSADAYVLNAKNDVIQKYLYTIIQTGNFFEYSVSVSMRSGMPKINRDELNAYSFFAPVTDEQLKIGNCILKYDHLITLHQRKLEKLKIIKKSMLENLFPQNGEKTPKIRFSGFTKDWEQRKFSELYELVNEKNDGSYGKDSNITVATMQFKSNIQISKNEYLNTYNIFKKGYIAFEGHKSKEFRFGRFVENDIGDGIVSHIFIVFRPIMEFDINFWKYAINNELIMQSILSRSTKASTMMNDLVVKDFLKEIFFVPFLGEQACIGKTLKSLDHLITLHQSKLEKLQKIKKSMLESIFV